MPEVKVQGYKITRAYVACISFLFQVNRSENAYNMTINVLLQTFVLEREKHS